jgi:hypothetical protein
LSATEIVAAPVATPVTVIFSLSTVTVASFSSLDLTVKGCVPFLNGLAYLNLCLGYAESKRIRSLVVIWVTGGEHERAEAKSCHHN